MSDARGKAHPHDLMLLWVSAAGRCSYPGCRLPLLLGDSGQHAATPIGEAAHIVAYSSHGPRGDPTIPVERLNAYANLILLCPNHHSEIDRRPDQFPPSLLHT